MKHPLFKSSTVSKSVIQCLMLLMGLWYSAVAFSSAEMDKIKTSHCEEITAANANNYDAKIQRQLQQIYKDNACFKKDINKKGNPLSDGDLGPLTKAWISNYLSSRPANDGQSSGAVDGNENKPIVLADPERPFVLTEGDIAYFALNADVFDILKDKQEKTYISQSALLDEIKTELAELEGMTDSLSNDYINQPGKFIEPVLHKSLTTEAIDLLMAKNKVFAANVLISQIDKPVSSDNFNKVIENLLQTAYLSHPEELTEDPKIKKPELQTKAKNESVKILKLIDPLVKKFDLYKIKDNGLDKSEFPSIDKDIIDCARNYVNVAFPGEQAIRLSLTSMLSKLTQLKNNKTVFNFSCTVTENDSTEETQFEEKKASKKASKEPKTEQPAYDNKALELLMRRAAAKSFIGSNLEPIKLKPLSLCTDCSLPMKGVSYGFYPFWQASTAYEDLGIQTINPATVDFSVFERIAYFAIPIEHDGSIKNLLHWEKKDDIKGFVQTLSKYNVERDLVLYSNSWENWGSGGSAINIQQAVYGFAETHKTRIMKLHDKVEEFGGLSGITLFFDGYSNKSNPANILSYINHLSEKIAEDKSINFDINLMLGINWDQDSCGADNVIDDDDKAYFQEFKHLLINTNADNEKNSVFLKMLTDFFSSDNRASADPPISNLLVFLNEPTSRSKKCLRMQIENEFHGEDRIDVLRKVIPILARVELKESAGKEEINDTKSEFRQFSDDISYLKDNFGGIATWPMPMDKFVEEPLDEEKKSELTNPDIQQMSRLLKQGFSEPYKNYMDYARLGFMGNLLNQPMITKYFSVCSVVCPNRSLINYSFVFLFITSLVSFVAFRVNCKARKFIIKMKWFDIALKFTTVMVFLSILGCDPDWQSSADSILITLVLYFIAYFIYQFFFCGYESQNEN